MLTTGNTVNILHYIGKEIISIQRKMSPQNDFDWKIHEIIIKEESISNCKQTLYNIMKYVQNNFFKKLKIGVAQPTKMQKG